MNEHYMDLAISLARQGEGLVNPNPLVGAVIIKDKRVIGQGYHHKYGDLHAERDALKQVTEDCNGASMYVTLEPCCHHGKQPPCTEAIINSGIDTVYIGSSDPNPLVAGKGISQLRAHGIKVIEHVKEKECNALNSVFFHYIRTKTPYVALKYAMTLDGKTATHLGNSKWITDAPAREHVHMLRNRYMGIMVGIGTVLSDDPLLTCRMTNGRNPIRIICDTHLRIPKECQIVRTAGKIPTIIAASEFADFEKRKFLEKHQITVLSLPEKGRHIDLTCLMQKLGEMNIDGILLEGGGMLAEAMLREHLIQYIYAYIAPKLFGGMGVFTPVCGNGIDYPKDAWQAHFANMTALGEDILLEYDMESR